MDFVEFVNFFWFHPFLMKDDDFMDDTFLASFSFLF